MYKVFLAILLFSDAAAARQLEFKSPLRVAAARDPRTLSGKPVDNMSLAVTPPSAALDLTSPRLSLSATYAPDLIVKSQHSEFDAWNHSVVSHFMFRANERLTIE